jgi:L-lactate dehydrogenase complex protein LldE
VRVQLFATCLGDLALPDAVADAESLLRAAGHEVVFPAGQTCCGQPAFNAGHHEAAARVARQFARAFSRKLPIVCPSGSGGGRGGEGTTEEDGHYLPKLIGSEPFEVYELSMFLSRQPSSQVLLEGRRVAYHDSCHLLRELGVSKEPRALLRAAGADVAELERPDLCCGFGGTFSVRQPEVSVAMADDKLADAQRTGAEALVTADPGCLLHLRARAARAGGPRVVHLATALARGLEHD